MVYLSGSSTKLVFSANLFLHLLNALGWRSIRGVFVCRDKKGPRRQLRGPGASHRREDVYKRQVLRTIWFGLAAVWNAVRVLIP